MATKVAKNPYRQTQPAVGLSLERFTDAVPTDGAYYLLLNGEIVGRYRSLKAAKTAWNHALDTSGWTPPKSELNPHDIQMRERRERWARNRAG